MRAAVDVHSRTYPSTFLPVEGSHGHAGDRLVTPGLKLRGIAAAVLTCPLRVEMVMHRTAWRQHG